MWAKPLTCRWCHDGNICVSLVRAFAPAATGWYRYGGCCVPPPPAQRNVGTELIRLSPTPTTGCMLSISITVGQPWSSTCLSGMICRSRTRCRNSSASFLMRRLALPILKSRAGAAGSSAVTAAWPMSCIALPIVPAFSDAAIAGALPVLLSAHVAAALKLITFPTMRRSRLDLHICSPKAASPG